MDIPEDLQAKIEEYNRNFDQLNSILGDESTIEKSVAADLRIEQTNEILAESLPVAVRTMVALCVSAVSESVKYRAASYLIDRCLGPTTGKPAEEDAATQLLRKLTGAVEKGTED